MKLLCTIAIILAVSNLICSIVESRELESDKIFTVSEALQLHKENHDFFQNYYILLKSCGVGGLDCVSDCELIIWHVDPKKFIPYKDGSHNERPEIETIIIKAGPLNLEQKNDLIGKQKCGIYKGYFITQNDEYGKQLRFLVDETIREEKIKKIKSNHLNSRWQIPNF